MTTVINCSSNHLQIIMFYLYFSDCLNDPRGLLHKTLTGIFSLYGKVNGEIMLTGVFRFDQSFFSAVKVLCNRPQGPDVASLKGKFSSGAEF